MEPVYIYKTSTGYIGSFKKRENEQEVEIATSAKDAERKISLLIKMDKVTHHK